MEIMQNSDTNGVNKVHDLINRRWSPRGFNSKPIEAWNIESLFEAARWAPSSFNEQPWRFIYATQDDPEEYQGLLDTLMERNQEWAQTAPLLIAGVAKTNLSRNDKPNKHALYDLGQAVNSIVLQATSLDLYVHQMAGFSPEKAIQSLDIPQGYEAVVMMAVGYSDKDAPTDRSRNELDSFLFKGRWSADQ